MPLPNNINPGDPIPAAWLNAVKNEVLRSITGDGKILVNRTGQSVTIALGVRIPGTGSSIRSVVVVGIEDNYLRCKSIDAEGEPTGEEFKVAKPPEMRHEKERYDGVVELETLESQKIEVKDANDNQEHWVVKPPYLLASGEEEEERKATLLAVVACDAAMGVTIEPEEGEGGEDEEPEVVTLLDLNIAGRVWGLTEL